MQLDQTQLILASSSAYRHELLSRLRLPFIAISPDIDETAFTHEAPEATALRLAKEKALAISALHPNTIVLGSDQVATLNGIQIGKPGNHVNALKQLQLMRGKEVVFHTALCVVDNRNDSTKVSRDEFEQVFIQTHNCQTKVKFRNLTDPELDAYLYIEKPYDCAGSAKNEGLGIALIEYIHSNDPTSLTGLPLIALTSMLRQLKMEFFR